MTLDHRIRVTLARMELLSFGSVSAWNSSGKKTKPTGGNRPPGDSNPPHEVFRARYVNAKSDRAREMVCEAAEAELVALTTRKRVKVKEETLDQLYDRLTLVKYEGEDARDVAHWERVTPTVVRRARVARERHVESGRPVVVVGETVRARVLGLAGSCSVRQIEMRTGVPRSTVHRILKEAA